MTTGWGNLIPRRGGHFSFPFEIGAIFTGAPTIGFNATGNACLTQADAADNGPSCENMATNPQAQTNIAAQVAKYQKDLNVRSPSIPSSPSASDTTSRSANTHLTLGLNRAPRMGAPS